MAGGAEASADDRIDGVSLVSVWHHDAMILCTHVDLRTLTMSAGSRVNVLSSRVCSNEADTFDVWVRADLCHGVTATLDDIDDAIGDARLFEQVDHHFCSAWDSLRGLEHEGVAERDRQREHPEGDHGREVVRSDTSHDSKRFSVRVDIDARSHILGSLTLGKRVEAASVFNDLVATENITGRVCKGLAMLLGHEPSQLISVLFEERLVLEHHADALGGGHVPPSLEGLISVRYGLVELILGGHGDLANDILGERALDIEALRGSGLDPLASNVVFVDFAEIASSGLRDHIYMKGFLSCNFYK